MRILLPPSEAKAEGGDGPSLRTAGFGDGPLSAARAEVARAVAAFCRDDPATAIVALRLPASRAEADLAANVAILDAPTTRALDRFVGVLYEALAPATLPPAARAAADHTLFVSNGAFGLIGAAEPVPDHRVAMAAAIPGLGGSAGSTVLATFWRAQLAPVLPDLLAAAPASAGEHLVVDLRSSDYVTVPRLAGPLRAGALPVRALTEKRVGGRWVRRPLSYQAKQVKGLLTRALLLAEAAGRPVKTIDDVAEAAEAAGLAAEPHGTPTAPTLDVITRWTPPGKPTRAPSGT
ncbi:peroxide stress protein YaaA [Frankia sp. AgB1.9]|uniref:peroxide stress protein YaaA n=2 Tax=Frankia TaxID=1854 RepID=UPI00193309CD|nr:MULTISPECIES: peroxide stress protein YaaA [unclassified Frankia]MBL7548630.1 peroxide stress protein YaaA [Frankia sp. AgB1.9]MBL7623489.1 peroxide stress protein YaaA [Frankia sp. AgB1.8]